MNKKLKIIGVLLLSLIGIIALFITVVGLGNYLQNNGYKTLGDIFMFLFPILVYVSVTVFNKKVNGLQISQYGFNLNGFFKNSLLGTLWAFGLMAVVLLVAIGFGISIQFMPLKDGFAEPLLTLLGTMVLVGVWEEFYFRGLIFNTLVKHQFGFHAAALISSILFSIAHWSSFDPNETSKLWYLGIVLIGYILVYMYAYTKSIWTVVFFHFFFNVINYILTDDTGEEIGLFRITNLDEYPMLMDNITVVCLGVILFLIVIIHQKKTL